MALQHREETYEEALRLRREGYTLRQISEHLKVPLGTIHSWIYYDVKPWAVTPSYEPSPELAYVVGALSSDGSLFSKGRYHRISLYSKDLDFIREFERCIRLLTGRKAPLPIYRRKDGSFVTWCSSKRFIKWWIEEEEERLRAVEKYPASFLRGFADGEGSVSKRLYRISISNTNYDLVELCRKALDSLGIRYHVHYRKQKNPRWKPLWTIYTADIPSLIKWYCFVGFTIKRKREALERLVKKALNAIYDARFGFGRKYLLMGVPSPYVWSRGLVR